MTDRGARHWGHRERQERREGPEHGECRGDRGLGLAEGTAMYVGAVLGPGVMSLPALGVAAAGPACLVAWGVLLLLSVPVALCFATLGGRHPDGGGISVFVHRAFGPAAAAATGWLFYAAVPVGILAGALVGGQYVGEAAGLDLSGRYGVAALLLAAAFAANFAGLRLSGRLQLVLVGVLAALLLVAIAIAAPDVRAARFQPFAPHGAGGVGQAALVVYYAFTGWEAAVHLSAEFREPRRHLLLATKLTLGVVGVLYLCLVVIVIGVLGDSAGRSAAPLTDLMRVGLGEGARPVTVVVAVLLSLGALNTFVAGAARLGASLGRTGAAPRVLARGGLAEQRPQVSLSVQMVATFVVTLVAAWWGVDLRTLMGLTSVMLGCVTLAGLAAAVRLLGGAGRGGRGGGAGGGPSDAGGGYRWLRAGAVVAAGADVVVLAFGGLMVLIPLAVVVAAVVGCRSGIRRASTVA